VLAAGLGTRLRPLTLVCAKPAIPVAGEPIIRRLVGWLAAQDVADIVVNLHHLPDTITGVLGDGSDLGARVRYSWEQPEVLGSAGGPRQALDLVGEETFLIVNGDTLTDLRLGPLIEAHRASGALVTLALAPNREPDVFGGVLLDAEGGVTGFVPRGPAAVGSYHFFSTQVVQAEVFRSLERGRPEKSIGGVYDRLIATRPGSIRGYQSDARYWHVETVDEYERTSAAFAAAEKGSGVFFDGSPDQDSRPLFGKRP
jgi:NDP-sugar pyrophosphorylase family protein